MPLFAFVGHARAMSPREAGMLAARQVLDQVGREPPVLAFVFASSYLPLNQVVSGVSAILGDIPLVGASTAGEYANNVMEEKSVTVGLLAGEDIKVQAGWTENYQSDSFQSAVDLFTKLKIGSDSGPLFVAADGLFGNANQLCNAIPDNYHLFGCLAGAYFRHIQTYQAGGRESGSSGLSAAFLGNQITCGVGTAHGWKPVGESFQITEVEGSTILSLDGKAPVEAYSDIFGYPGDQWILPPLNELVRLYPFGLQMDADSPLVIRSPLRVEEYGIVRMQAPVMEHTIAHIMIGTRDDCLVAAEKATRDAISELNGASPVFAIVLTDVSWRVLMETQPGLELEIVRNILGSDIPIIGGYVYAQLSGKPGDSPKLLNQHIEVVLLGRAAL